MSDVPLNCHCLKICMAEAFRNKMVVALELHNSLPLSEMTSANVDR